MTESTEPDLITMEEAAELLELSVFTLKRRVEAGDLTRYRREGFRGVRVDRAEVEKLGAWRPV